jgi:hypothetical protein
MSANFYSRSLAVEFFAHRSNNLTFEKLLGEQIQCYATNSEKSIAGAEWVSAPIEM